MSAAAGPPQGGAARNMEPRQRRTIVTPSFEATVCTHLNGTVSPAKAGVQKV